MKHPVSIDFAWRGRSWLRARAGVSLHSHTLHSRETLEFIPRWAAHVPVARALVRAMERRYCAMHGRPLNYLDTWWTPPLGPRESLAVERGQIETLGLKALVSLSDHDNIEAPLLLRLFEEGRSSPVSVEWTLPYRGVVFHLGVHNLPPRRATHFMAALAAFTSAPREVEIEGLLAWLDDEPDTLVVMNHPYWDEKQVGQGRHSFMAEEFLRRYRRYIHALELNGLRPWSENRRVAALAARVERPIVSGGDRHGCEPNALINLTNASTFSEFVEEIRDYGLSHVLVMPQYREPIMTRILKVIADILRDNVAHTHGWVRWSDRVFVRDPGTAEVTPLSRVWTERGQPWLIRGCAAAGRHLDSRGLRFALRPFSAPAQELA